MSSQNHLANSAIFQLLRYTWLRDQLKFDKEALVLWFSNDLRTFLSFRMENKINTTVNETFLELSTGKFPTSSYLYDFLHFSNHYKQQCLAANSYSG